MQVWGFLPAFIVPTGCRCAGCSCYFADVSKNVLMLLLFGVFPPFPALRLVHRLQTCLIWRFKGVFSAVWGCCVGLFVLRALRGLWGLCVRERLGGLETCSVFASIFPLLCLYFIHFSSSSPIFWGFAFVVLFLSSCLPCLFLCPCGFLLFLFPLRTTRKKKGRAVLVRPLLSCCGLVYKSLNIIAICCGSSFQCLLPLQIIPATSSGCFVVSLAFCPSLFTIDHFQSLRQSEG